VQTVLGTWFGEHWDPQWIIKGELPEPSVTIGCLVGAVCFGGNDDDGDGYLMTTDIGQATKLVAKRCDTIATYPMTIYAAETEQQGAKNKSC